MTMVEEGVVIIALVIPDSYIAREYTSDPLRSVSGAVEHTMMSLLFMRHSLHCFVFFVFFFKIV